MGPVTEKKVGTTDLASIIAEKRAAASTPPAGPEPVEEPAAEPVAVGEEESPSPAPAKKRAAKKSPTPRKRAAKAAQPEPEPEPEPDPEESDEDSSSDPLAGLRRDEQPMKVQLGQRVSAETAKRFRRFCAVEGLNQGEFLDLALREALDRYSQ